MFPRPPDSVAAGSTRDPSPTCSSPRFKPEKTTSFEIGEKSEFFDHKVRANAALYFSQYRQVVITSQTVDATGAPFTAPQNVGSADIKGFELELEANPVAGLQLSATVGLTDFKWKSLGTSVGCQDLGAGADPGVNCISGNPGYGDISPGISKWKGNVGAQYEMPVGADSTLTPRVDFSARRSVSTTTGTTTHRRRAGCSYAGPRPPVRALDVGEQSSCLVGGRLRHQPDEPVLLSELSRSACLRRRADVGPARRAARVGNYFQEKLPIGSPLRLGADDLATGTPVAFF